MGEAAGSGCDKTEGVAPYETHWEGGVHGGTKYSCGDANTAGRAGTGQPCAHQKGGAEWGSGA